MRSNNTTLSVFEATHSHNVPSYKGGERGHAQSVCVFKSACFRFRVNNVKVLEYDYVKVLPVCTHHVEVSTYDTTEKCVYKRFF